MGAIQHTEDTREKHYVKAYQIYKERFSGETGIQSWLREQLGAILQDKIEKNNRSLIPLSVLSVGSGTGGSL